ncbi:MAG TPA: hypothetical protein VNC50_09985, partial [Planctomycetia bacterium]|nr:hypothetical protein [Planctomycetia bacterium]
MVAKTPYPIAGDDFGWGDDERYEAERIAHWALVEDLGSAGDITTAATIPDGRRAAAAIKARRAGIVAGLPCLPVILDLHRGGVEFEPAMTDGPIKAGGTAGRLRGPLKGILEVERTCLNFLCRLSGTATMTGEFVELAAGTRAKICDTRKTTPGWRRLEKYAVRVGGGVNHRIGLFDAVLIKDN